ncbi:MAG: hypothetical protein GXZ19_01335 [Bacteroidales bacterium]|nr:hypothetical protein [Bacteroidales bacterium]
MQSREKREYRGLHQGTPFRLQNRLFQVKDALERSKLEFHDVLIGQGFKLDSLV